VYNKNKRESSIDNFIKIGKKTNGILEINLENGKLKIFKDSIYSIDSTLYPEYTVIGFYPEINCYLITVNFYENGKCILLNKKNGSEYNIWSEPIISPDKKHFVTFLGSLGYPVKPNGIQFFDVNGDEIKLVWEFETDEWKPDELFWISDKQLILKQCNPDFNSKNNTCEKKYFKMILQ